MADQKIVNEVSDWMMTHPGQPVHFDTFPEGMADEVQKEIDRRHGRGPADDAAAHDNAARTEEAFNKTSRGWQDAQDNNDRWSAHNPIIAGVRGAVQGTQLGHADEIQGLLHMLGGGDYKATRNYNRAEDATAAKEHPLEYYGANALGSMLLPIKGAGAEASIPLGATAALGYSDKDISDPSLRDDVEAGGLVGGVIGQAGKAVGKGVGWLAGKAGKSADRLLMNALGLTSEELDSLKANASMKDLLDVVRRNGGLMSGARDISESISDEAGVGQKGMPIAFPGRGEQVPVEQPSAAALAGKPEQYSGSTTAQELPGVGQFNQRSLDQAFEQSYKPKTVPADIYDPAVPPVPPVPQPPPTPYEGPQVSSMQQAQPALGGVQRLAVQKLNKIHDASGSSLLAPKGMPASTFQGGVVSAVMARSGLPLAITGKKMAQAISDYVKVSGAGLPAAMQARVNAMVDQVMQSPDPEFTDYLAKETLPEYLAISLEVDKQDHTPGAADAGQ